MDLVKLLELHSYCAHCATKGIHILALHFVACKFVRIHVDTRAKQVVSSQQPTLKFQFHVKAVLSCHFLAFKSR